MQSWHRACCAHDAPPASNTEGTLIRLQCGGTNLGSVKYMVMPQRTEMLLFVFVLCSMDSLPTSLKMMITSIKRQCKSWPELLQSIYAAACCCILVLFND